MEMESSGRGMPGARLQHSAAEILGSTVAHGAVQSGHCNVVSPPRASPAMGAAQDWQGTKVAYTHLSPYSLQALSFVSLFFSWL